MCPEKMSSISTSFNSALGGYGKVVTLEKLHISPRSNWEQKQDLSKTSNKQKTV
jgi:hypothetical protein